MCGQCGWVCVYEWSGDSSDDINLYASRAGI
jgi:hypothetical protein